MADKLQKTLNIDPSVASRGRPLAPDTSLADAIVSATEIGSQALIESKKEGLQEDLETLGKEVHFASEGLELKETSERFEALKKAKEQGVLSSTMVNIETEKVLKERIANNSAVAPELRKLAHEILGFDPTGSATMALYGKSGRNYPTKKLTEAEKTRAVAENTAKILDLDADNVERAMVQAAYGDIQLKNAENMAKAGGIGANGIRDAVEGNIDTYVADATANLINRLKNGDGIVNPELAGIEIDQAFETAFSDFKSSVRKANITLSTSELAAHREYFKNSFQGIRDSFTDEASLESMLTRDKNTVSALIGIQAIKLHPTAAIVREAYGGASVSDVMGIINKITDPHQREAYMRMNPELGEVLGNIEGGASELVLSINHILGVKTAKGMSNGGGTSNPHVDDIVTRELTGSAKEPKVRRGVLNHRKKRGKTFKDYSDFSQKGVYELSTPEEKVYVKESFALDLPVLKKRIAAGLASKDGMITLRVENGKVVADKGFDKSKTGFNPFADIPIGVVNDLKRLNVMKKVMDNGFDTGISAEGFLERTINEVSTLQDNEVSRRDAHVKSEEAIKAYRANPSEENLDAIRIANPELGASIDAKLAERGVKQNGEQ